MCSLNFFKFLKLENMKTNKPIQPNRLKGAASPEGLNPLFYILILAFTFIIFAKIGGA